MFTVTAYSPYTTYEVGTYASLDEAARECETRYRVRGLVFKETIGAWQALVAGEEGLIVLRATQGGDE